MSLNIFSFALIALSICRLHGENSKQEPKDPLAEEVIDPKTPSVINAAKYFAREFNKMQKDGYSYKVGTVFNATRKILEGFRLRHKMELKLLRTFCQDEVLDGDADNCPLDPFLINWKDRVCNATIDDGMVFGNLVVDHKCKAIY